MNPVKDVVVCGSGTFATALIVKAHMNHADDLDRNHKALRKAVAVIVTTADDVYPMTLESLAFSMKFSTRISSLPSWDFQRVGSFQFSQWWDSTRFRGA